MRRENKIAVYLICDDKNIMPLAYLRYLSEFRCCPYSPYRIMRATQYQYLIVRVDSLPLQVFEIDLITPVYEFERVLNNFPMVASDDHAEFKENGRLYDNPIAFI